MKGNYVMIDILYFYITLNLKSILTMILQTCGCKVVLFNCSINRGSSLLGDSKL